MNKNTQNPTATDWHNWKITDEQAEAIRNGDAEARNKFYFDNLDKIRVMAYRHCYYRPHCRGYFVDMVNGVYADLAIFNSAVGQPVTNVWRLRKFIYASFNACPHGGLVYLYEHNRKLLSGNKAYFAPSNILSLDTPLNFKAHNRDGGHKMTIEEIVPTPELPDESDYDIIRQVACRYLSPRSADYLGYFIEGYKDTEIKALTGDKRTNLSIVRKELIPHCKAILADLSAFGLNMEYFYKIDPNKKTEKRYKYTPEEREKRRLWTRNWRAKQKAKKAAAQAAQVAQEPCPILLDCRGE